MDFLDLSMTKLTEVPKIPSYVKRINLSENYITVLQDLPDYIEELTIDSNETLTTIVNLPKNLKRFKCSYNFLLESLPELPEGLIELMCNKNKLAYLPQLPSSLKKLKCRSNELLFLPRLPNTLTQLTIDKNKITKLEYLPSTLKVLSFNNNPITEIPPLPKGLYKLDCSVTNLIGLPQLPQNLKELLCYSLNLSNIKVNKNLEFLDCSLNNLAKLPYLSDNLKTLKCGGNKQLESIFVPSNLEILSCRDCNIHTISKLPDTLIYLNISNNKLNFLPKLPNSLRFISFHSNPVLKVPKLNPNIKFISYYDTYINENDIPEKLRYISDPSILSSIEYKNNDIETMILPKGTLLFRNAKSDILNDFIGVLTPKDINNYYMFPNHQVYFYPSPFGLDKIAEYPRMTAYYTTHDIEITLGIYPSLTYRDNYSLQYVNNCSKLEISSLYKGRRYDPCFEEDFMKEFPNILGRIEVSATDGRKHVEVGYEHPEISKFYHYSEDINNNIGIAEIVLHPKRNRSLKEEIIPVSEDLNLDYVLNNLNQFNYAPFLIGEHKKFKKDEFYQYVTNLLSPNGLEVDGEVYHATIDTRTKMLVLVEKVDEETLQYCIDVNEKNKYRFI